MQSTALFRQSVPGASYVGFGTFVATTQRQATTNPDHTCHQTWTETQTQTWTQTETTTPTTTATRVDPDSDSGCGFGGEVIAVV
jgi:hypothetical protein